MLNLFRYYAGKSLSTFYNTLSIAKASKFTKHLKQFILF